MISVLNKIVKGHATTVMTYVAIMLTVSSGFHALNMDMYEQPYVTRFLLEKLLVDFESFMVVLLSNGKTDLVGFRVRVIS